MVGVGCISGIYLQNFRDVFRDVELVAVCDLIRERAQKAQEEYNIPKLYDTTEELFADNGIDLVLNLTRPYQHYDVSKAALLAGKHVYCEKPLGADLEEGIELVALAKEKGLIIGGDSDIVFFNGETGKEEKYPLVFDYKNNSRCLGVDDTAKAIETGRTGRATSLQTFHMLEAMAGVLESAKTGKPYVLSSHFEKEAPMDPSLPHGIL